MQGPSSTLQKGIRVCEYASNFERLTLMTNLVISLAFSRWKRQPNSPHRYWDICVETDSLCHCKHDTHRVGGVDIDGLNGLAWGSQTIAFLINTGWILGKGDLGSPNRPSELPKRNICSKLAYVPTTDMN